MNAMKTIIESMRKEERIQSILPVKFFLNEDDKFGSLACRCEVTHNKVTMAQSEGIDSINQTVWVERQNRKAKYRVIWIGRTGNLEGQIGLELVESNIAPWDHRASQNLA